MHIPDGFLDAKTAIATSTFSLAGLSMAFRHLKRTIVPAEVPLIGLAAAFIFVAQMLNFPVAAGTSGHLMGSVLLSVLLGPSASIVVMSTVLIVQCFLFADGGVTALGANIFNMGVAGSLIGYSVYRTVYKLFPSDQGKLTAIAFASWCSIVIASILCAGELAWSGTVHWSAGFTAMTNIHMMIGVGEGIITTLVVVGIAKTRPELIERTHRQGSSVRYGDILVYGTIITLGLILFISPFISQWPDGLEMVASTIGFEQRALTQPLVSAPLADYTVNGILTAEFATIIAGSVGAIVVFGLSFMLARILSAKPKI